MKKISLSIILSLFLVKTVFSQVNFTFKEWETPSVVELGKEPPHTFALSYANPEDVFANDFTKSPYYKSLFGCVDVVKFPHSVERFVVR